MTLVRSLRPESPSESPLRLVDAAVACLCVGMRVDASLTGRSALAARSHTQNCGNVPSVGSSPAHLSGAATPNKEQNRIIGFIGPPDLNNNFPQGPGAGAINLSLFKPVGAHEPESLSLSLSPQQRARNAALKQHQHQHQQKMFGGGPNMRPNGLEPGGGLTNPGPGPFGRGPSPFEGHLGYVPASAPNPAPPQRPLCSAYVSLRSA